MKLPVPFFAAAFIFSSCTSFQYLTVNSTALPYAGKQFVASKDSLEISYEFNGYNALLLLQIKNNSSQAVTVDWKRSAIITNGITVSLYNKELPLVAGAAYDTNYNQQSVRRTTVTGTLSLPGETDFIPPFSTLQKKTTQSISRPLNIILAYDEKLVKESSLNQRLKFTGKSFTSENTPCKIRVYLTYTTGSNTQSRSIEDDFFVAELFESTKGPLVMEELLGADRPVVYTY